MAALRRSGYIEYLDADLELPDQIARDQELRDRILQGIAAINAAPVVHRWKRLDLLNPANQDLL